MPTCTSIHPSIHWVLQHQAKQAISDIPLAKCSSSSWGFPCHSRLDGTYNPSVEVWISGRISSQLDMPRRPPNRSVREASLSFDWSTSAGSFLTQRLFAELPMDFWQLHQTACPSYVPFSPHLWTRPKSLQSPWLGAITLHPPGGKHPLFLEDDAPSKPGGWVMWCPMLTKRTCLPV